VDNHNSVVGTGSFELEAAWRTAGTASDLAVACVASDIEGMVDRIRVLLHAQKRKRKKEQVEDRSISSYSLSRSWKNTNRQYAVLLSMILEPSRNRLHPLGFVYR
jgi:hypothetical protein